MAENSGIEWTTHTFNPWWGCVRVSEACRHCYAETFAGRFGVQWGPQAQRRFFGEKHWNEPRKWARRAGERGVRERVFCASMADVFEKLPEGHPDEDAMELARAQLWQLIEETPELDWLLLTKRPENITVPVPDAWLEGFPANVWVGTTVEDAAQVAKRIPHLIQVPAAVRFLSCEPLLGYVYLGSYLSVWDDQTCQRRVIDWVIAGGESGPGARPMHPDWARSLRNQCQSAGVAFHFKQWGDLVPAGHHPADTTAAEYDRATVLDGQAFYPVGKKRAGRLLDGRTWDEFPAALATPADHATACAGCGEPLVAAPSEGGLCPPCEEITGRAEEEFAR